MQVLATIPMAMIGAVAFVVATDQTVSIAVLVGLISLAGVAARNGILLIDHYLHVMREEGRPFGVETVLKAGKERLIPVLMTALCTGIALVPIALTPDRPGRELLYPVATVILGGLVSSTLLDLLVTPGPVPDPRPPRGRGVRTTARAPRSGRARAGRGARPSVARGADAACGRRPTRFHSSSSRRSPCEYVTRSPSSLRSGSPSAAARTTRPERARPRSPRPRPTPTSTVRTAARSSSSARRKATSSSSTTPTAATRPSTSSART